METPITELVKGDKIKIGFNAGFDYVEKVNLKENKVYLKNNRMNIKGDKFIKLD